MKISGSKFYLLPLINRSRVSMVIRHLDADWRGALGQNQNVGRTLDVPSMVIATSAADYSKLHAVGEN
jgi:hypothetical protein